MTPREIEESYDSMLDCCFPDLIIAGMHYCTSRAHKEVDPIAYRCGLLDYVSTLISGGDITEEEGGRV